MAATCLMRNTEAERPPPWAPGLSCGPRGRPCNGPLGLKVGEQGSKRADHGELTGSPNRGAMRGSHGGPRRRLFCGTGQHVVSPKAWKEMVLSAIQGGWGRNLIMVKKEKQNTVHQTFPLPPNLEAGPPQAGCIPDSLHLSQGEEAVCPAHVCLGLKAT